MARRDLSTTHCHLQTWSVGVKTVQTGPDPPLEGQQERERTAGFQAFELVRGADLLSFSLPLAVPSVL